jgi:cold shock CspA family protein
MSSNTEDVTPFSSEILTGRVKWFNNKAGYGFITVTDGSRSGTDIFVHHSSIQVVNEQYKYLVQGEYVNFGLTKTTSSSHEWQAANVCGINSGKLMCETRRDFKAARSTYKSVKSDNVTEQEQEQVQVQVQLPRQRKVAPRARGGGPRDGDKRSSTAGEKAPASRSKAPRQTQQS